MNFQPLPYSRENPVASKTNAYFGSLHWSLHRITSKYSHVNPVHQPVREKETNAIESAAAVQELMKALTHSSPSCSAVRLISRLALPTVRHVHIRNGEIIFDIPALHEILHRRPHEICTIF